MFFKKSTPEKLKSEMNRGIVVDGPRPPEPGLHRQPGPHGPHRGRLLADGLGAGHRCHRHALKVRSDSWERTNYKNEFM